MNAPQTRDTKGGADTYQCALTILRKLVSDLEARLQEARKRDH